MRRWWLAGGLALVLALVGLGVGVAWRSGDDRPCGDAVVSYDAAGSRSPFVDPPVAADEQLLDALGEYGEVVGGFGYDYEPPQVTSYAEGLGVRLRDDNRFTLLDDDLAPRWSVAVGTRSSTFDRSEELYVVVTLPEDDGPEVVALDLATGERRWCTALGGDAVTDEPVSTEVLDDGSVLVLVGGAEQRLARVTSDGVAWREAPAAGRADFAGTGPGGAVVVGGSPLPDLLDPAALADRPAGARVAAHDAGTGERLWAVEEPAGSDVSVLGTTADRVLLTRAEAGAAQPELVAVDGAGREAWRTTPSAGTAFDATVRGDRVLVRAGTRWTAYAADDGEELWTFSVRDDPQLLPYGTTLAGLPSLDADTLLVGATDALVTLDLRDGSRTRVPLPTDGVATTWWPVALAVSPDLVGVVTNVATVVVRR